VKNSKRNKTRRERGGREARRGAGEGACKIRIDSQTLRMKGLG